MELGAAVFALTNVLLAAGWFILAIALWRVRSRKPLRGGEYPVVFTLLVYGIMRVLILLDFKPWEMTTLMGLMSGLTIASVLIIYKILRDLRNSPLPPTGPTLVLNGDIAKTYAAIKNCNGNGH